MNAPRTTTTTTTMMTMTVVTVRTVAIIYYIIFRDFRVLSFDFYLRAIRSHIVVRLREIKSFIFQEKKMKKNKKKTINRIYSVVGGGMARTIYFFPLVRCCCCTDFVSTRLLLFPLKPSLFWISVAMELLFSWKFPPRDHL